jgi:hypothetical protein
MKFSRANSHFKLFRIGVPVINKHPDEGADDLRKNRIDVLDTVRFIDDNILEIKTKLVCLLAAAKCSVGRKRLTDDWG